MTKINIVANCENSPRKEFLKEYNIAFATGNADFIIEHASNEINWIIYGDKTVIGKKDFNKEVNKMKEYIADEMTLHHIITHGSEASANGEIKMNGRVYAFCDIYQFTNTTSLILKKIQSYVIEIKN